MIYAALLIVFIGLTLAREADNERNYWITAASLAVAGSVLLYLFRLPMLIPMLLGFIIGVLFGQAFRLSLSIPATAVAALITGIMGAFLGAALLAGVFS